MPATLNRYNPLRLLNSVLFGVTLMALIAVYLAAGSGRQWLRSTGVDQWPVARDWFDKTDLEFFNAWPLKTLMALLVANLVVVTWRKIPLTPPRYGVWCVHAGIITLVLGTATYYGNKLEGRVRIYADPAAGPSSVTSTTTRTSGPCTSAPGRTCRRRSRCRRCRGSSSTTRRSATPTACAAGGCGTCSRR